YMQDLEFPYSF
nr:immunoglobulin light chain junction region [Macaca mulatta]MOX55951.1 immunoglobulin light chain junction region [Macaca mulatta]MOX55970.1 immunoglobulin light chain junction region [Macaca mulatta]MOX57426.1 immunoglobulin light chain junction region [Macaca mulatta]